MRAELPNDVASLLQQVRAVMGPEAFDLASQYAQHGEFGEAVDIVRAVMLASGAELEPSTRQLLDDLVVEMDEGS